MLSFRRLFCLILCAILLMGLPLSVFAQDNVSLLYITSLDSFLRFAENCRLDSYSRGLTVILSADIDLTGTDFSGIPIFSGTFEGHGNRITGLSITKSGSGQGLFRYLTSTAVVRNLHVEGTVTPGGSASAVGGLAGSNAGSLEGCSFTGTVSGIDRIGGLVGTNALTGLISECTVSGQVHGNHFVGGIAGQSSGVIRNCENLAQINGTIEQNDVALEDITLESITTTEFAATVTDIGGICGTGSGVIRACINRGNVGYLQVGYNIGGIAGSHSGYIDSCHNYGSVDGRKEVGGIVGQLEPAASVEYAEDTLQTLQEQMDGMAAITGAASTHAQSGSSGIHAQAQKLDGYVEDARDALSILVPDVENPTLPDEDAILAAQNTLTSSLSGITESINTMASIGESTISALGQDIKAITSQVTAISGTIGNAAENLGGSITDVSDADTADILTSKTEACINRGTVRGDWNVGGVVGAIAFENDLDPDSDLQLIGDSSLNFAMELRSVILDCQNMGTVLGKKQNTGGIAGWVSLGLLKNCVNYGSVEADAADYAGGIAGQSSGFIRGCSAKCTLTADSYVGGIAGAAATVSDCRAIVQLHAAGEKAGGILGILEDAELTANYYLPIGQDPGGVDGISYDTLAQPLDAKAMFALEDLPPLFSQVTLYFQFEDGTRSGTAVSYGTQLTEAMFPPLPEKDGFEVIWDGPVAIGEPVYFDCTFTAAYTGHISILESSAQSQDGRAILLVQGEFLQDAAFSIEALALSDHVEAWALTLPESKAPITLRYLIPEGYAADDLSLSIQTEDGQWVPVTYRTSGSYLVFSAPDGAQALKAERIPTDYTLYMLAAIAFAVLLLAVITVLILRKRRKKAKK